MLAQAMFLLPETGGDMKKLEEMNLVDDFLVYSLTAHKIYGEESARYILECILQRSIKHLTVLPQKTWYGENQGSHGVRLDVYLDEEEGEIFDVEPDQELFFFTPREKREIRRRPLGI